jgi:hypothetical protein
LSGGGVESKRGFPRSKSSAHFYGQPFRIRLLFQDIMNYRKHIARNSDRQSENMSPSREAPAAARYNRPVQRFQKSGSEHTFLLGLPAIQRIDTNLVCSVHYSD